MVVVASVFKEMNVAAAKTTFFSARAAKVLCLFFCVGSVEFLPRIPKPKPKKTKQYFWESVEVSEKCTRIEMTYPTINQ